MQNTPELRKDDFLEKMIAEYYNGKPNPDDTGKILKIVCVKL